MTWKNTHWLSPTAYRSHLHKNTRPMMKTSVRLTLTALCPVRCHRTSCSSRRSPRKRPSPLLRGFACQASAARLLYISWFLVTEGHSVSSHTCYVFLALVLQSGGSPSVASLTCILNCRLLYCSRLRMEQGLALPPTPSRYAPCPTV